MITTKTEASQPGPRTRTKIGVGERVTLTVAPGPGTWTAAKGTLSAKSGATVTFTAPDRAGSVEVSVTVGAQSAKVDFDVIEPDGVHMDVNGRRHIANGRPNAGIHTDIYISPADVSFANIELRELEVHASTSGHWAAFGNPGHHPNAAWGPMTSTVVSGKGTKFAFMDNALSGETGVLNPIAGTMSWNIPWQFHVGSGAAKTFATVVQSVVTDSAGATTVSKAGASTTFNLTDPEVSYSGSPY